MSYNQADIICDLSTLMKEKGISQIGMQSFAIPTDSEWGGYIEVKFVRKTGASSTASLRAKVFAAKMEWLRLKDELSSYKSQAFLEAYAAIKE